MAVAVNNPLNRYSYTPIDPQYGHIKFFKVSQGINENDYFKVLSTIELESHLCSNEELGLSGDHSNFFPINKKQERTFELNRRSFICVD